ncbi:hypothetical protein CS8_086830 [Cupriavidus sp. 8B]
MAAPPGQSSEKDERRHNQSACPGNDGKHDLRGCRELTTDHLALDLQAYQEEKMAISPSLIQSRSGFAMASDPDRISTGIFSRSS